MLCCDCNLLSCRHCCCYTLLYDCLVIITTTVNSTLQYSIYIICAVRTRTSIPPANTVSQYLRYFTALSYHVSPVRFLVIHACRFRESEACLQIDALPSPCPDQTCSARLEGRTYSLPASFCCRLIHRVVSSTWISSLYTAYSTPVYIPTKPT